MPPDVRLRPLREDEFPAWDAAHRREYLHGLVEHAGLPAADAEAKVERVLRDLGNAVRPGDPLVVMSSVVLGETKAQHLALKARLETARAAYERERRLFEDRISSQAEVLEAEAQFGAAGADAATRDPRAPQSGREPTGLLETQTDSGAADVGEDELDVPAWSDVESFSKKDFAEFSESELAAARAAIERLEWQPRADAKLIVNEMSLAS